MPAPLQESGRKHAEHKLFYTTSPKYLNLVLSFLLCSTCIYALRDGGALQTSIPLLRAQRETLTQTCRCSRDYSHPGNTAATTEQFLSRPSPPPSPRGTDPSWVGAVGEQPPTAGRSPSRSAKTRFSPQTSAEHVQGERFEMFIKWPSLAAKQSHSAAKSQQHGGARAAQIGRYLTVSKQGKLLFFLFPKSWWCQSHISHMPHTAALPLKLLHCKEKSLSRLTANAWEVLDFRSTHHNNRKVHYG